MKNQKGFVGFIVAFMMIAIIFSFVVVPNYMSVDYVNDVYIKDKERIVQSESSYYLVYTDERVYKNTDTLYFFKFNSSDVYNDLERGSTCDLKVNWFRVPFMSWYENILEVSNCRKG